MVWIDPNINETIADMAVVQTRVKAEAVACEMRMKALISPHNKSSHLFDSVKTERSFKHKDWWVHVEAKYAVPVNYGFIHHWTHKRVKGINFIKAGVFGA